jgi:cytochrome c
MMKTLKLAFCLSLTLLVCFQAQANEQIARNNQCFKCHAIDSKKKAPSFQAIAREYSGSDGAEEIARTIRKGITSIFGVEKMPANSRMSDAELRLLTQWILQQ